MQTCVSNSSHKFCRMFCLKGNACTVLSTQHFLANPSTTGLATLFMKDGSSNLAAWVQRAPQRQFSAHCLTAESNFALPLYHFPPAEAKKNAQRNFLSFNVII